MELKNYILNLPKKSLDVLFRPYDFFDTAIKEKNISPSLIYLIFFTAITEIVVSTFLNKIKIGYFSLINALIVVAINFIVALAIWLYFKVFRINTTFLSAFKLFIYTQTPIWVVGNGVYLFGNVNETLNNVLTLWGFMLLILGTTIFYKVSYLKSLAIWFLVLAILTLLPDGSEAIYTR